MRAKRIALGLVGIAVVVAGIAYGALVHRLRQDGPVALLACGGSAPAIMSWTCRAILTNDSLRPDQVAQLNREAGAAYPLMVDDPGYAAEMLSLFLARGVDINARSQKTKHHWTALHLLAMDGRPDRVAMLLKHGARPDVKDEDGMTALDLARRDQQAYPNERDRIEVIRLLEAAERQQASASK